MSAQVLAPIGITTAMLTACSVAEPDATTGEVAWSAATVYAIGDEVVRTTTHRVYTALASGADAGLPESTPLRWDNTRPSNKWAAFDTYRSTRITSSSTLTMTVTPGIITGMAFFGLIGDTLQVVCKDASTLVTYYDETVSLSTYLSGDLMWEFYYGMSRQQETLRIANLYPHDAQVEITLTVSPTTGTAAIGIFALGSWAFIGEPTYGFKAKPISYSRIITDAYGETEIIPGRSAKDISGECVLKQSEAQAAADTVNDLLGTPCAWVITDVLGYDYLNAFGLGSADVSADDPTKATLSLEVKGSI